MKFTMPQNHPNILNGVSLTTVPSVSSRIHECLENEEIPITEIIMRQNFDREFFVNIVI